MGLSEAMSARSERLCSRKVGRTFLRDEEMAEETGAAFGQFPVVPIRPERGQFVAGETGANTDRRVMPGDCAAADQRNAAAEEERAGRAAGFDRDEHTGLFRRVTEKRA